MGYVVYLRLNELCDGLCSIFTFERVIDGLCSIFTFERVM